MGAESHPERRDNSTGGSASVFYRLTVTIRDKEEAKALQDLIEDLGYSTRLFEAECPNEGLMSETRLGYIILEHMRFNRTYRTDDFTDVLVEKRYAPRSASVALSRLADEGFVRRVHPGTYVRVK